jgi:small redox-active disulfide protein 2
MKIVVAGPGCARCHAAEKAVRDAVAELGQPHEVEHLFDVREYAKLGVRLTPAVVVDGKVAISGRVPSVDEVKRLLSQG